MDILNKVRKINENYNLYNFYVSELNSFDMDMNIELSGKDIRNVQRKVFLHYNNCGISFTWRIDYFNLLNKEREELNKMRRIRKQKSILNNLINVSSSQKRVRL